MIDFPNLDELDVVVPEQMNSFVSDYNDYSTRQKLTDALSIRFPDFEIICNENNNTPEIIDQFKLVLDVRHKTFRQFARRYTLQPSVNDPFTHTQIIIG